MNRKIMVILLVFSLILTISSVSALENNEELSDFDEIKTDSKNTISDSSILTENTDNENMMESKINIENENSINDFQIETEQDNKHDANPLSKSEKGKYLKDSESASFKDLENQINSNTNGTLDFNMDYLFNPDTDSDLTNGIIINKSLVINGNSHTINANNNGRIFNILSNHSVYINNLNFLNGNSNLGSAILSKSIISLNNTSFINNSAKETGGAISTYEDIIVNNSYFYRNTVPISSNKFGGAIYSKKNIFISNSRFDLSESNTGGAIYGLKNLTVTNSIFRNNSANSEYSDGGGAINAPNVTVQNSIFEYNYGNYGGAISSKNLLVENSNFTNNSAEKIGGALKSSNLNINNSIFKYNNAKFGGAVFSGNNSDINNSKFINNSVNYGGGAICAEGLNNLVNNTFFTYNKALSYAGCILGNNINVMNSNFTKNSAKAYGGAILAANLSSYNNNFYENDANNGTHVFAISNSNLANQGNEYLLLNISKTEKAKYAGEIVFSTAERGFCAESAAFSPRNGYMIEDMTAVRNSKTGENVNEYVKILIYEYYFNQSVFEPYSMFQFIWAFTDGNYTDYGKKYPPIQHVIDLYNSGFRVPTYNASKILDNGTVVTFNFRFFLSPNSDQNAVVFNLTFEEINQTVKKETLNPKVLIGQIVEFRIVLTNNGQDPINNPYIIDEDYSNGLVYMNWKIENGNWTKKSNKYILNELLLPGSSRSFIIIFNTTENGTLVNNISSGYNNINISNSSNKTIVLKPDLEIIKISNNRTVKVGETVSFTIIVKNTGDCNLTGVYIKDNEYSNGLVYLSYIDLNEDCTLTWKFDGKDTWTYMGILEPGKSVSLKILFKAITEGVKINNAIAGHNLTNDTVNSTNTTKVIKDEPKNTTNTTTPENPKEDETPDENRTVEKVPKKENILSLKAGNPVLVLLLSLISLALIPRRNRK